MKLIFYCFIGISFLFLSCDRKEKKAEKKTEKVDREQPFYMINLPDTIDSGVPIVFEIKLSYPTRSKEKYFSHLILSDSLEITLENILEKAAGFPSIDLLYDITEIHTDHWEVSRTFNKKGNFIVKGGIFVHTMEFGNTKNDSIKVFEKRHIVPIERKVYVK